MFSSQGRASYKASIVARKLAEHKTHKSHARHLSRDDCKELGLVIEDLEHDQTLQDLVLSVFHASTITFTVTPASKIIENHNGKAFIKLAGAMIRVPIQPQQPSPQPPSSTPPKPAGTPLSVPVQAA